MSNSLVSICIPTFNGAEYLQEALDSVKQQTYNTIEVIVSDDASLDNTLAIVEQFKQSVTFPVNVYNHEPYGIAANWNNCIKKANGQYIKFLFQDDVLLPDCVEKMVALALTEKNVGLVYCKRTIIYNPEVLFDADWVKKFNNLHTFWNELTLKEGVLPGTAYLKDENFLNYPLNKIGEPTAVLLHKDVFKKVGFFSSKLNQELDLEFWYRLMPYFKIGFIDQELIKFRLHGNQATQINKKSNNKDSKLLPLLFFKHIFKYLHPNEKKKLITIIYKNTYFYKFYSRVRKKLKLR